MKRMIFYMPDDPRKHLIYDGVHIINMAAETSNVYYIIRKIEATDRSETRKVE